MTNGDVASDDVYAELSQALGSATVGDPYPLFAERRRASPVMAGDIMTEFGLPSRSGGRPAFTFFKYDDIVAALQDGDTYSSAVIMEMHEPIFGRSLLGMDGDEHRAHRGMITPAFARSLVELWRERILRPVARSMAADIAAAPGRRADLFDFAMRFPMRMVYEIIGFPRDEQRYEEFSRSGTTMLIALAGIKTSSPEETKRTVARAQREADSVYGTLLEIVRAKRTDDPDADDFIGHLLRAEFEGQQLTDEQITAFLRTLLPAATETTTRNWLNVMACLLEHPQALEEVCADRSLLLPAIDEGMRFESAFTVLARLATRDVVVRDVEVPAGSAVTLVVASANRDEDAYERPDEFDLHRTKPRPSLGFGFGRHRCLGANTARYEMLEAASALLDALPGLRPDPDAARPEIRGMMLRSPAELKVTWD